MAKKEFAKGDEVLLLSTENHRESTRGHIESVPMKEGRRRKCVMQTN